MDDQEERHKSFKRNYFEGNDLVRVYDAQEAINSLLSMGPNRFDVAFLDHDLGGIPFEPCSDKCGCAVAKFIRDNPQYRPKLIIVHSLNKGGADLMLGKMGLDAINHIPFAWEKVNLIKIGE